MVEVAGSIGSMVSPVLESAKWLAAPIWHPFKYLYNYSTNFKNLKEGVDKLKNTRGEVQHKVIAAERNVEEIRQNVKDWLEGVEKKINEAEQLIQEKANSPRCFKGLCPNFITSYKQSKKAFKLRWDDIDSLLQQERELGTVSFPTNPPDIWLRSNENYLGFESRSSIEKNVWDALNDENVYMVGIYGMGGLGKTTLVQELGRKVEKEKLFEEIVFVEISEILDIKRIQRTAADKLGLKFENESEMANKLYTRMKDKNILLILDNIWETLDLTTTFGIPSRADRGRNKLLLTTRNLDVLEKMDCTHNFGMGILNQEEAWTLFTKMAGNVIQTRELHSLPNDVCNECEQLPIVICTIAKALKNKRHPSDWKVALQDLRAPSPAKFTGLLEKEYIKIGLSYKYLRDDELKKIFLISSLLENNASISDLLKHVMCLDILERANLTMEDARDRLDKLVRDLKDACMLLDGFESGRFAMHDVIRHVAITIAYVDHHVFTTRNDVEREWKDRDKFKKCTKISLYGDSTIISQLWPNDLDCPNLEYFSMTNIRNSSFKIPNDFFKVMSKLRVLNLVRLQPLSLLSSIDFLTNLQTLCLDHSQIEDVVMIGRLKKLKILSLRHIGIEELPIEMGQLTQLRLLDLTNCWKLEVIAPNVISKLSQLEELYMKGCHIQWKIEILKELKLLSSLTSLELEIKDSKVLPEHFFSNELKRYKISVGFSLYPYPMNGKREYLRILKLEFNRTIYIEELYGMKNVEFLHLSTCLRDDSFHSNEITPLFNNKVIFPDLMVLKLEDITFIKIWDNQLPTSSFENLKELKLWRCTKIKYVFPSTIIKSLQQLQYIEIAFCTVLEGIVAAEDETEAAGNLFFPQVTKLKLEFLPKFTDIYPGMHTLEWPNLKELVVKGCDKFKVFTLEPNSLCLEQKVNSDVKRLTLSGRDIKSIWQEELEENFGRVETLELIKDEYAYIPIHMLIKFTSLENLILKMNSYKEVFTCGEGEEYVGILPKLKVLKLQGLFNLKCIWKQDFQFKSILQNIQSLKVEYCHNLTTLLPPLSCFKNLRSLGVKHCNGMQNLMTLSTAESLVCLENLLVRGCEMMTEVLANEGDVEKDEIVFEKLKELSLIDLESLACFCSGNYILKFPFLESLWVWKCSKMKTFSREGLYMPRLQKVNDEACADDLNSVTQQLQNN